MAYCMLFIVVLIGVASVNSTSRNSDDWLYFAGRKMSPGEQCRFHGPFGGVCAASDPADRCLNMRCADTDSYDIPAPWNVGPALQGTPCGDNKICIGGQCVEDPLPPKNPRVIKEFQYGCEKPF